MIRNFKDITISNGTYGTSLTFEIYDANQADEDLSQYSSVKAKFYTLTNSRTEKFGGACSIDGNLAMYTFQKNDLVENGIYKIKLELLKSDYRNIVDIEYSLIVE
jgi:hypothetical protein